MYILALMIMSCFFLVVIDRYRDHNWFWVPFVGPHVGAIVGAALYILLVSLHIPHGDDDTTDSADDADRCTSP
jgi:hypothetical protein